MQEQHNCSCDGSNENCCHCGGRGFISIGHDSVGMSTLRVRPLKRRKMPLPPVGPQSKSRANLGFVSPSSNLASQRNQSKATPTGTQFAPSSVQKAHTEAQLALSSTRDRILHNGFVACHFCHYAFHLKFIDTHLFACPMRLAGKDLPTKAFAPIKEEKVVWTVVRSAASIPRRMRVTQKAVALREGVELCPMCKVLVSPARITSHKANRCPKRPNVPGQAIQSRAVSGPKSKMNPQSTRSVRNSGGQTQRKKETVQISNPHEDLIEAMPQELVMDRMEANRGMGFFARENGRFGSHPLHDRFDDESGPENWF